MNRWKQKSVGPHLVIARCLSHFTSLFVRVSSLSLKDIQYIAFLLSFICSFFSIKVKLFHKDCSWPSVLYHYMWQHFHLEILKLVVTLQSCTLCVNVNCSLLGKKKHFEIKKLFRSVKVFVCGFLNVVKIHKHLLCISCSFLSLVLWPLTKV